MVQYLIDFNITADSKADLITILTWLKDNYGAKVNKAVGKSSTLNIAGHITEASFVDAVTALTAFDTYLGSKVTDLDLVFDMSV